MLAFGLGTSVALVAVGLARRLPRATCALGNHNFGRHGARHGNLLIARGSMAGNAMAATCTT